MRWALLVLIPMLAGCFGGDAPEPEMTPEPTVEPSPEPTPEPTPEPANASAPLGIRFIAFGDTGTGKEGQFQVAAAVEQVCAARGCDFAVALGDNIYESGAANEYDPQFETKFEIPYANLSMPFYMVLGNHDNSYDPSTGYHGQDPGIGHWWEAGNVQVAYHYRENRTSEKWQLPARYYAFDEGNVSFLGLDSNTLMYRNIQPGAWDQAQDAQEQWIQEAMEQANGTWKIAVAHHPYISNGEHGDAGNYEGHNYEPVTGSQQVPHPASGFYIKEFYEQHLCGKVDFILSGHDHDLQWLNATDSCGATQFIVSGAGAKTRSLANEERNEALFQQGDTLGFFHIEIVEGTFTARVYDAEATLLFEHAVQKAL